MERARKAEFFRSAVSAADLLEDGRPQVAFMGRSNVGKSSLLNTLLRRKKLARTSSTPGRTQTVNYFLIDDKLWFVDLPGYGYARASKQKRASWARLMETYFERALPATTVVLLVDGKVGGTDLDREAVAYLRAKGGDPLVVATKIDKVPRGRRRAQVDAVRSRLELDPGHPVVEFSAATGEGTKELWREIAARATG